MPTLTPRPPQPPMGGACKGNIWYKTLVKVLFTTGALFGCKFFLRFPTAHIIDIFPLEKLRGVLRGSAPVPSTGILLCGHATHPVRKQLGTQRRLKLYEWTSKAKDL